VILCVVMGLLGSSGSTDCQSNDTNAAAGSMDTSVAAAMDLSAGSHDTAVIILPRSELDRANKDKRHYPEDFEVN